MVKVTISSRFMNVCETAKREKHEKDNNPHSALYLKLDEIESSNPGTLKAILPALENIKDLEKYSKQRSTIIVIIEYIQNKAPDYEQQPY